MRLFVGIPIPDSASASLERLLAHLRPLAHLKWSPIYNLHITTKFIGDWPEARLEELTSTLESVRGTAPFTVQINGLGWFPNPHHPHVFFAAVPKSEAIRTLHVTTEAALEKLGVTKDEKTFTPHLTLARVMPDTPLENLRRAIAELESVDFGSFEAAEFHLYASDPGPAGTVYKSLSRFRLAAA